MPDGKRKEIQISDQVKLKYKGTELLEAYDYPEIVKLIFYVAVATLTKASVEEAVKWLFEKLKGKKIEKLIIERTEVELDQGKIKKVIEEKLKAES